MCIRNAGIRSRVSISWNSERQPDVERYGRSVVEEAVASLPDDPIRASRSTTITYGANNWSISNVPAFHALDLANRIFPKMMELWNAWCEARTGQPDSVNFTATVVRKRPVDLPAWLRTP